MNKIKFISLLLILVLAAGNLFAGGGSRNGSGELLSS